LRDPTSGGGVPCRDVGDRGMDGDGYRRRGGMTIADRWATFWSTAFSRGPRHIIWPFAELEATRDRVSISVVGFEPFVVTLGNLLSITRFGGVPVIGLGLRFDGDFRRESAVFWTAVRSAVIGEPAYLGWSVDDGPAGPVLGHRGVAGFRWR
jgi:hypothetical protein